MRSRQISESGFTLVEMLVALGIFSLISVAGVALLQSASKTQLVVKDRLGELGTMARTVAVLETDAAQAVARPVRTGSSTTAPAFAGGATETTGQLFAFTRMGWSNLDNAPRPELQRVAYALEGSTLKRMGWSMPDGGTAQSTILLEKVTSAKVRFRDADGYWRNDWEANDPLAMPRAIELIISQQQEAPVTVLFLVGSGVGPLPVSAEQEDQGRDAT